MIRAYGGILMAKNFSYGQKLNSIFQKLTIIFFIISLSTCHANETIRLGITGVALKDDLETLIGLKKYLAQKSGIDIEFKFAKSYSVMESFITNKSVDIAYICGATYVNLNKTNSVELFVIPTINGKNTYSSLVITKAKKPYKNLFDLKNQTFAMSDPDSNSGSLVPIYEILRRFPKENKFFKKIIYTYDHGESIQAVLSGFVEGASVDSMVYDVFISKNPQYKKKLMVINNFGGYPAPPFVIRKDITFVKKTKLQNSFLNMHKDNIGKSILKSLAIEKFVKPNDISYQKIEEIKSFISKHENYNVR